MPTKQEAVHSATHFAGTNSRVVRIREGSANPSTHFIDALVLYFSPKPAVTASRIRALRTNLPITGISSFAICIVPFGSFLKDWNHPVRLSFQERTKTLSSTTTTHTPVKRCSAPERTPRIFAFRIASTMALSNLMSFDIFESAGFASKSVQPAKQAQA